MKRLLTAALLLLAPVAAQAQQTGTEAERRAALEARRDSLEAEVVRKFVEHLARDLSLTDAQQTQTVRILQESGLRRRALSRESSQLRSRIYRSARDTTTADAEFVRLLSEYDALRAREHDLWRSDQAQLARVLEPRQRAQFLLSWSRFQDDIREIISRRMREDGDSRDRRDDHDRRRRNERREHNHKRGDSGSPDQR